MPKLPIDYSNAIIYKLSCKDKNITELYIGSTTNFTNRKNQHKTACNNSSGKNYNQIKYKFIRENGGWENWEMIEIEKIQCNSKRELEKKEEEIRCKFDAKLNSVVCWRDKKKCLINVCDNICSYGIFCKKHRYRTSILLSDCI